MRLEPIRDTMVSADTRRGLWFLFAAVAMLLVIVYVGAVAVLFLFVVMMLDVDFAALRQGFLQYLPIGGLIGLHCHGECGLAVPSAQAHHHTCA